jgi:hypothetical protein
MQSHPASYRSSKVNQEIIEKDLLHLDQQKVFTLRIYRDIKTKVLQNVGKLKEGKIRHTVTRPEIMLEQQQ